MRASLDLLLWRFYRSKWSGAVEKCWASLFKMLGWMFAETGKKCCPFTDNCRALGVLFDLSGSTMCRCLIRNTERRVEELVAVSGVLDSGVLSRLHAQRLRGRMQFAESRLFGRTGRRCVKAIAGHATGTVYRLSEHSKRCLKRFMSLLTLADPRLVVTQFGVNPHFYWCLLRERCWTMVCRHWRRDVWRDN